MTLPTLAKLMNVEISANIAPDDITQLIAELLMMTVQDRKNIIGTLPSCVQKALFNSLDEDGRGELLEELAETT